MSKTKISLLAILFLLCNSTFAQIIDWQQTIGGTLSETLGSMKLTTGGGYIFCGVSNSNISGYKSENNWDTTLSSSDFWVIKTDSLGTIEWENTIGGDIGEFTYSIVQTNDGGYFIGGYSTSNISGDKTENSNGYYDFWVVKIDSIGSIQWQNTIGGVGDDKLMSVQQTIDGGFILGGHSTSNISGDKMENNIDTMFQTPDYWIVKLDSIGNIEWQNTIGGNLRDYLRSIRQTSDGGYILGGYSESNISGDKAENSTSGTWDYDYWIIKIDDLGNIQWQNTIGGNGEDILYDIAQTSDGGYILGGNSNSNLSGDKSENNWDTTLFFPDYWIVKTDSLGNIQWQNKIGGNHDDRLYTITQVSDGSYIMGGYSSSNISGNKTENCKGMVDYWIVKTDSVCLIEWQKTIGGNGSDYLSSIVEITNESYIVTGYSNSNISGDKSANSTSGNGDNDYWIIKLCLNSYDTVSVISCGSFNSPSGTQVWDVTGIYSDTLTNVAGCDSIISINLTVYPNTIVSIAAQGITTFCQGDSVILSATPGLLYYQWYRRNYAIPGATFENYSVKSTGRYKCIVQNAAACLDTSNTIVVNVPCIQIGPNHERAISINEYETPSLQIFPNPGTGIFTIQSPLGQLQVFDFTGKIILSMELYTEFSNFDISEYSAGIYCVMLKTGETINSRKIILSH